MEGHRGCAWADAEVTAASGTVSEWIQVVGAVRAISDQIYRDGIRVAAPRSPVGMQEHD
jgi:hypothetical protein